MQVPTVQSVEPPENAQTDGASQRSTAQSSDVAGVFLLLLAQFGQSSSLTLAPGLTGESGEGLDAAAQSAVAQGAVAQADAALGADAQGADAFGSGVEGEAVNPASSLPSSEATLATIESAVGAATPRGGLAAGASESFVEGEIAAADVVEGKAQYRLLPVKDAAQVAGTTELSDAAQADSPELAEVLPLSRAKLEVLPSAAAKLASAAPDSESILTAEVRPEVQPTSVKAEAPPVQMGGKAMEMPAEFGQTEAVAPRDGVRPEPVAALRELANHAIKSVRYLVSQGERTMKVRLVPESLGELRLEVTASGSTITVRMASANPAVREVLEGHLQGLRDALSKDGFDSTDVFVSADASSGENESGWMQRDAHEFAGASKARGQATGTMRSATRDAGMARESLRASPHTGTFSISV